MRVLIANPYGIGDLLFSLPLVHALRQEDPEGFLGALTNARTEDLVARTFPVDWTRSFEKDQWRSIWRQSPGEGFKMLRHLIGQIRGQRFDLVLDLSLGWQYGLAAFLAGIPRRVGFNFRGRGRFLTDRVALTGFDVKPAADYYLELLKPLGILPPRRVPLVLNLPETVLREAGEYLGSLGADPSSRLVGIVPGGGRSWGPYATLKQWPAERFASVADGFMERHGAVVVLIGDAQETELCQTVADRMSRRPLMAIQVPSLTLLAGILKRCELVVGNDSGPLHLAAAVGAKTVTIFGPVDASVYGPLGFSHRVVSKALACRPCYREFRLPPCPWDNRCLKELSTEPVQEAAEALLAASR